MAKNYDETSERHEASRSDTPRILLAEDNGEMRDLLALTLRSEGYQVVECAHGVELGQRLHPLFENQPVPYELVVSDIRMPGLTGIEILEAIHETKARLPVILITAFGDNDTHEAAAACGAFALLDKPFTLDKLIAAVREALDNE